MTLGKINTYLSTYQVIGFIVTFIILAIYFLNEGLLMFYIPLIAILFLPFITVSSLGILNKVKHESKIKGAIQISSFLLIIPSLTLPFFFELGGLAITISCLIIGIIKYQFRADVNKQLLIFNIIGGLLLTSIIILFIYNHYNPPII